MVIPKKLLFQKDDVYFNEKSTFRERERDEKTSGSYFSSFLFFLPCLETFCKRFRWSFWRFGLLLYSTFLHVFTSLLNKNSIPTYFFYKSVFPQKLLNNAPFHSFYRIWKQKFYNFDNNLLLNYSN